MALHGFQRGQGRPPELDGHHVVALVGLDVALEAVADGADGATAGDDALREEEPGGQLEVGSRCAHGHRERPALASRGHADLHGLLGGQLVGTHPGPAGLHDRHLDRGGAAGPPPHRGSYTRPSRSMARTPLSTTARLKARPSERRRWHPSSPRAW